MYLHFFRISCWNFILVFWLGHVFLFIYMPYNFLLEIWHLKKKQPPVSIFAYWFNVGEDIHNSV